MLTCPHCSTPINLRELPHQGLFTATRVCPACTGRFTPDRDTKVRQALFLVVALIALALTVMLSVDGIDWLGPALAGYLALGVLLYRGDKNLRLVPDAGDRLDIVAYQPEFARSIADLFHDSVHASARSHYTQRQIEAWAPTPPDYEAWAARLARKEPYVAVLDARVVGFIELEPDGHIDCLYVHPDHQRRGIAGRLYRHLEKAAEERGIDRLFVEASHMAKPFFAKNGFVATRQNRVNRNGVELVNVCMEKDLTDT